VSISPLSITELPCSRSRKDPGWLEVLQDECAYIWSHHAWPRSQICKNTCTTKI